MDLLAYFRVLRRHWRLIVAVTVAGAALGAASTLLDRSSTTNRTYFRATNTLVFDDSTSSEGTSARHFANPAVIAILATTGDVPERVAETLGTDETSRELATRVSTVVNQDSDTLELTVIDPNAQRAALLADTFSDELIASLTTKELDEFTKSLDSASDRVTSAQQDRDRLLPQVLANPQDQFTQSQYAAAASIYGTRVAQFLTMQNAGAPTPAVSTLEPAEAVPIGNAEYEALLNAGETGRNHFQAAGDTNTFVTPSSGSSFDDPVSRGVLGGLLGLLAGVGLALGGRQAGSASPHPGGRGDRVRAAGARRSAEAHQRAATPARPRRGLVAALAWRGGLPRGAHVTALPARGGGGGTRTHAVGEGTATSTDSHALFEPEQLAPLVLMVTSALTGRGQDDHEREPRRGVRRGGILGARLELRLPSPVDPRDVRGARRTPAGAGDRGPRGEGRHQRHRPMPARTRRRSSPPSDR